MPNNVTNEIKFYGQPEDIKVVRSLIKGSKDDRPMIDFNRIIPMPDELNVEDGSGLYEAMDVYLTLVNPDVVTWHRGLEKLDDCDFTEIMRQYRRVAKYTYGNVTMTASEVDAMVERLTDNNDFDAVINRGRQGINNLMKYGAASRYDWRVSHWGTKWNAYYQYSDSDDSIGFDTAWSMPEPILRKLAEICNEHNVQFNGQWINEDWRKDSGAFVMSDGSLMVYRDMTEEDARERCKDLWNYDPVEDGRRRGKGTCRSAHACSERGY